MISNSGLGYVLGAGIFLGSTLVPRLWRWARRPRLTPDTTIGYVLDPRRFESEVVRRFGPQSEILRELARVKVMAHMLCADGRGGKLFYLMIPDVMEPETVITQRNLGDLLESIASDGFQAGLAAAEKRS